jgi:ferredoxin-NADP reductase
MITWIDDILNEITMYRLVLYVLFFLAGAAAVLGATGTLHYSPLSIIYLNTVLITFCWIVNYIFSKVFKVPTNVESVYITALILGLIISPPTSRNYVGILPFLAWASVWAMASKYILAIKKKHIFNPAAFAVALTAFTLGNSASWWIGTSSMLPLVIICGLLITRKIQRFDLVISFVFSALTMIVLTTLSRSTPLSSIQKALVDAPILFFAFIMLTEPLTSPPTRPRRIAYGIFTGLIFANAIHIGPVYSTPELTLLVGNIFSYFLSPKEKYMLRLKEKIHAAVGMYDFVFTSDQKMNFKPGQYLEWTLGHRPSDTRGNRRYFTIASSPTEPEVRLGVKFYEKPSSFKKALLGLPTGKNILAGQLSGDFTLPKDTNKKLAFIAGGIGITPFRSMIKYAIDKNEPRDITLFYSNKTADEIMYKDIFDEASKKIALKTVYTITDTTKIPPQWAGQQGHVTPEMIKNKVPDFQERIFYISGPHTMTTAFRQTLREMEIPISHIKTDFFPGLA